MSSNANENTAQQNAPESESNPSAELAGSAHGEYAADAAAHLERSGGSLEGFGGDSQEIDRQTASLMVWAREKNLILTEEHTANLFKHQSTTAEHQVFYRASDNRASNALIPAHSG